MKKAFVCPCGNSEDFIEVAHFVLFNVNALGERGVIDESSTSHYECLGCNTMYTPEDFFPEGEDNHAVDGTVSFHSQDCTAIKNQKIVSCKCWEPK